MKLVPAPALIACGSACAVAALAIVVVPGAALLLVALDAIVVIAAILDLIVTPSPKLLNPSRLAPDRMTISTPSAVWIDVLNTSRNNLYVRINDSWPDGFVASVAEVRAMVSPGGRTRLTYEVRAGGRGRHRWGSIHLAMRSLLRLWEWRVSIPADFRTDVYPNLDGLERFELLALRNRQDVIGARRMRLRGGAWEFESLRDYATGDDIRTIDWKATARHSTLIVRNHQAERNQTVIVLIDSGRLMNAEVKGVSKLESALSAALILSHVALSRGDRVGLSAFSNKVHVWVAPRARAAQFRLLSDNLFDLKADYNESDHGRCLRLVARRYPKRALLVVLTDFVDVQTAAEMVAHLRLSGRRNLVLFVALGDPFLSTAADCRPETRLDGFRTASAIELVHDRLEVLEQIRQMGGHVIDADPSDITPKLVNGYLEIVLRGLL